ncbi:unnamed protein product [Lymnaea stagnalis]|uniref:Condensin complex subunit 1 C-terminal domain-containing protein n=1 Tax=Lymnaea stagnalis TaxID=6523 RepID=A0AAV2IQD2_LYMST
MPKRVTLLIQSIIAAPCIGDSEHQDSSGSQTEGSCSQQGQSDSQDSNSQMTAPSSQASQPLSQFKGSKMSTRLRAHAFVTLGKLCLVDESLAKKTIAALARELEESDSPAIRNNVVIVMGDLTIRYTTLVDRYVTNMAVCLKDPSALVRKNTLTILTRLLQEEYIKWKGVLFFRYITTLLDETPEIKDLAEFCLEHLLLKKHPTMFFHPFIECIFHFNNYQTHPVYNKFTQSEKEKQKFTLAGTNNDSRRRQLYMFMLEHMSDEQKFKVAAKTNKEILSAVVDKIIPLDENGSQLLRDALAILSSKEIKLSTMRGRGAEDTDEITDVVQLVTDTAKKALISHVIKRNVIENIVPAVISLKHILEKNRSPLLRDLMGYLQELMKDYKTEIKEVLSADKQLAEEIEFDLRNFVSRETESEARGTSEANTPRSNTPTIIGHKSLPGSPVLIVNPNPQEVLAVRQQSAENVSARLPETEIGSRQSSTLNPKNSSSRPSLTILDAAKRAMTRVDQLRQTEAAVSPVRSDKGSSSPASVKSSSGKDSRNSSLKSTTSQSSETTSPTQRNTQIRAISTPTAALSNITFATDGNITMLPPSPIPSVASARKGGKLCMSPNVKVQQKGKKHIIYMPHPEAVDPKPVKWNIQSPTAKRQDVTSSGDSTPSRKAHNKSQAGIRRSSRPRNREEL